MQIKDNLNLESSIRFEMQGFRLDFAWAEFDQDQLKYLACVEFYNRKRRDGLKTRCAGFASSGPVTSAHLTSMQQLSITNY